MQASHKSHPDETIYKVLLKLQTYVCPINIYKISGAFK
jgi:hypothetical protein